MQCIYTEFVNLNGHTVHYKYIRNILNGNGSKTFLFINSLGTDFRIWGDVVDVLQAYGNIVLFDKRGHGLSETVEDTSGLNSYVEDVVALLEHLSIQQCIVVGVSVGGMIAQLLAYCYPEKVEQLILCDTRHKIADADFWNSRIEKIKAEGLPSISRDLMKRWFAPSFHQNYPEKVTGYRNMLERSNVQGYIQTCEAIRDADLTENAKHIRRKTLCIVGSEDLSTTVEEVKTLSDLIPGATFKVIEDSGHLPCVDNPAKLSNLIVEFITNKIYERRTF